MKIRQKWKKAGSILLAGIVACMGSACGSSEMAAAPENGSTEYVQEEAMEYSSADVSACKLPENFDSMILPVKALMVEEYSQGLPYYDKDGNPDSFWFSMAVLSSLMTESEYISPKFEEEYYYYSKEELDVLASALYGSYAQGDMELAKLPEDSRYVSYREEKDQYGLLYGSLGTLSFQIMGCQAREEGYLIDALIENGETGNILAGYQLDIRPDPDEEPGQIFHYSIYDIQPVEAGEMVYDATEPEKPSAEGDFDEVDGQEITDDSDDDLIDSAIEEAQISISRKDALKQAKSYMGEDAKYQFKQMVTIGDYDYYDFGVKSEELSFTDVFVSINGQEIFGGVHNADGSWSFDQ